MGFDKARASVGGWPMAVVVARTLRAAAGRVALVRRGPPDGHPWIWPDQHPIEVIREADDGERHPLKGVASALDAARTALVLIAPCDVPSLTPGTVRALVAVGRPVVLRDPERIHPLVGVFAASDAPRAAALAAAGRPVRALIDDHAVLQVDAPLANVNVAGDVLDRREDLARRFAPSKAGDLERMLEAEAARRLAGRGAWIPWATGPDRGDP